MAAFQWVFRTTVTFLAVFITFVLLLTTKTSRAQGSGNNTTDANTTSTLQPTTVTIIAPTTTTEQARTTQPPTAFPSNTDLGPCPCDLTGNGCDVNCCCDLDCSQYDRLAFSMCTANSYLSKTDDKVCLQQNVIIIENTPFEKNTTSDGLFCVYYDNYAQRNYYNIPDIITSEDLSRLEEYADSYGGPSFQAGSRTDPRTYSSYYRSGDPIYTVYESNALGVLGQPKSVHSSLCEDSNPAAYLYEEMTSCGRAMSDLGAQCQTELAINAATYYKGFKVISTPGLFERYVPPSNDTTTAPSSTSTTTASCDTLIVEDLYNNSCVTGIIPHSPHQCLTAPDGIPRLCNYTDLPQPRYDPATGECHNAILKVEYIIGHNGTYGIKTVGVKFVLATIRQSDLPLSQTFVARFEGIRETDVVSRSGNPGYLVGQPVLAGLVVRQTAADSETIKLAIQLNGTDPNYNSLTMVRPSLSGECGTGTGDRTNVVFGEDMRTGCFITFTVGDMTSSCQRMQEIALLALWPYGPDPPRNWSVATFGNSDPDTVGDWVTILVQNTPRPAVPGLDAECIDMVLGMHIQVIYANVGSLSNPQPKIVGVSFVYESSQTIAFQCIGPYCQPGAETRTQRFEIVQSVSFIDVSQPSAEIMAEAPIFLAKVPYDFFYPFGLGAGSTAKHQISVITAAAMLSFILVKLLSFQHFFLAV